MASIHAPMRVGFELVEKWADKIFTPAWNPFYHLGALGFFMYWIVAVSGIYVYIFFDTGLTEAYDSVEYMTHEQWYLAGIMRSLHRYCSDAMVLFMVIHTLREFALDRYRGPRWFTWFTGVPVFLLLISCGITGYWLVWDELAQFIALRSTEWMDWLPIFGSPIANNFITPERLDDRFFSLMIFIHIAAPLFLLIVLWVHLMRVSRPEVNPPRGLAIGMLIAFLVLSLVKPALSHGPADLTQVVANVRLDWFYLAFYPLLDIWSFGTVWGFMTALVLMFLIVPWMPPMRKVPVAVVNLEECNGCTRCAEDCPTGAVTMQMRTDGTKYALEATVNSSTCISCGICVGACPTSTPFRRRSNVVSGIELPELTIADLRQRIHDTAAKLSGNTRILVIGCKYSAGLDPDEVPNTVKIEINCLGMLPPSFIDYVISRKLADGLFFTGCREGNCHHRFGQDWTNERVDGKRDPKLRKRVPRERIKQFRAGIADEKMLVDGVREFAEHIATLPKPETGPSREDKPENNDAAKTDGYSDA
ncbi:MAG: hydrogenase iron-sulfur subunit [bacterium]|nr:hydrogenase iron-sulfur subunit [bacterium]